MGALIHLEVGEPEDPVVLPRRGPGSSQDHLGAGDDLGESERFRHVVVSADGEPGELVLQRVPGGEEEDRRPHPVGAEPPGHLDPVQVGEHHVEDYQIGRVVLRFPQRRAAVRGLLDLEALVASDVETASTIEGSSSTTRIFCPSWARLFWAGIRTSCLMGRMLVPSSPFLGLRCDPAGNGRQISAASGTP